MNSLTCLHCDSLPEDLSAQDLSIALEPLRFELEHLWPAEDRDGAHVATKAVTRAVEGLSLELDYLWPPTA